LKKTNEEGPTKNEKLASTEYPLCFSYCGLEIAGDWGSQQTSRLDGHSPFEKKRTSPYFSFLFS
jgi:hypothetical protein